MFLVGLHCDVFIVMLHSMKIFDSAKANHTDNTQVSDDI